MALIVISMISQIVLVSLVDLSQFLLVELLAGLKTLFPTTLEYPGDLSEILDRQLTFQLGQLCQVNGTLFLDLGLTLLVEHLGGVG